ncbi:MAG: hypothetical protein WC152_00790 [Candidatus Izemoplasmatales bacterium]
MPNHITNIITINGVSKERTAEILAAIRSDEDGLQRNSLDFNKIIPMPENIFRGNLGKAEKELYGKNNWYDWSVRNWGSKWNSYGYDSPAFHNADNEIEFLTAWSRVDPIMERLSQIFPDAEFFYQWADEDIGSNVGQQTWQNGEITDEFIPDHLSAGAYELAADIMGVDLAEHGLQYSEDDETYHYVDSDMDESEEPGMGGLT